jgi:hypothetical protein
LAKPRTFSFTRAFKWHKLKRKLALRGFIFFKAVKMKRFMLVLISSGLSLVLLAGLVQAQVQVSAGVNVDGFHMAIGDYYRVPQAQVVVCQQRHIPDVEMPVVFFIAQRAHVPVAKVIELRSRGWGWMRIAGFYRMNPRVFYLALDRRLVVGTPYERIYGYYDHPGRFTLADADIVNLVNLRFTSEYYHRPPAEIIRLRAGGRGFREIHQQYYAPPRHDRDRRDDHDHRDDDHHWDRDNH